MDGDHAGCRLGQFARWTRVMLEHERSFISGEMARTAAFMPAWERDLLLHDLADIDRCLAALGEPLRVQVR